MRVIRLVPLPGVLAVIYAILVYTQGDVLGRELFALSMPSQTALKFLVSDLLICLGLLCLFLEVIKATKISRSSVVDHIMSMLVFVVCLVALLMVPRCGTATFLIVTLISFIDVAMGFTVSLASARRDIEMTPIGSH